MERRSLLKLLGGVAVIPSIPEVKSVEQLTLQPTDAIVLTVRDEISEETARSIREQVKPHFPNHKVWVLSDGMEMKIVKGVS
jgi:hypothetical protein